MLKILTRALILLLLVFVLTATIIYQIGQRQASASPFPQGRFRPEGETRFFAPEGPRPFERGEFEGRERRGFSPLFGLLGVGGRLILIVIVAALVVFIGKAVRWSLTSAPLPQNGLSRGNE